MNTFFQSSKFQALQSKSGDSFTEGDQIFLVKIESEAEKKSFEVKEILTSASLPGVGTFSLEGCDEQLAEKFSHLLKHSGPVFQSLHFLKGLAKICHKKGDNMTAESLQYEFKEIKDLIKTKKFQELYNFLNQYDEKRCMALLALREGSILDYVDEELMPKSIYSLYNDQDVQNILTNLDRKQWISEDMFYEPVLHAQYGKKVHDYLTFIKENSSSLRQQLA